jgi:CobQ-like glutamine amidotransferase family enzyme
VIQEGYARGRILASYAHGHWASNPVIAQNLVASLIQKNGVCPEADAVVRIQHS